MTYGPNEHAHNLARIGKVARDLEAASETLRAVRVDVLEDVPADGQKARDKLRNAARNLVDALAALDEAVELLPTPVVSADPSESAYDKFYGGKL